MIFFVFNFNPFPFQVSWKSLYEVHSDHASKIKLAIITTELWSIFSTWALFLLKVVFLFCFPVSRINLHNVRSDQLETEQLRL